MAQTMTAGVQGYRAVEAGMGIRSVVVASADAELRHRLNQCLTGLRWTVREATGGAEAMELVEKDRPEALLVDSWLPDLEANELTGQLVAMYPAMDLLRMDGGMGKSMTGTRSPRRHELLHAMREAQEASVPAARPEDEPEPAALAPAARAAVRDEPGSDAGTAERTLVERVAAEDPAAVGSLPEPATEVLRDVETQREGMAQRALKPRLESPEQAMPRRAVTLPGMVGGSPAMLELARLIRLVAPKTATVLLEGQTGTGKDVAARAVHRLSARAAKPFVVLNCAAIPESLLEAELFGHTRGAFTGAVQSRTGRIEAAHGGTLFLDEIGEMPLALQAKMLRFLENGEIQRVGDNETMRVDVRVIAATHQLLEQRAEGGTFRLDLYHRLAVFPLVIPALRERMEDLPALVEFFLEQMGRESARKTVSAGAMELMRAYNWPGNVRELMHVLERGAILADDQPEIGVPEIRLRAARRG